MELSLFHDVLLHIYRLTDSERSAGKTKLTIHRLPGPVDPAIRDTVHAGELRRSCGPSLRATGGIEGSATTI